MGLFFSASCTCSAFISNKNGQGNCEYLWKGELWCYVNQPSNCKDLGNSTSHPGKQWSLIACKERRGNVVEYVIDLYNV